MTVYDKYMQSLDKKNGTPDKASLVGKVYLCPTCGRVSKHPHLAIEAPKGWEKCCQFFSVLVLESTIVKEEGLVRYTQVAHV